MKAADSDQTYLGTLQALLKGESKVNIILVLKRICSYIRKGGIFQRMNV